RLLDVAGGDPEHPLGEEPEGARGAALRVEDGVALLGGEELAFDEQVAEAEGAFPRGGPGGRGGRRGGVAPLGGGGEGIGAGDAGECLEGERHAVSPRASGASRRPRKAAADPPRRRARGIGARGGVPERGGRIGPG